MPHIIVEYSDNLEQGFDIAELLNHLHDSLAQQGIDKARIKTRSIALKNSVIGLNPVNEGEMIHTTLLLLEGRETALKKQYANALYAIVKQAVEKNFSDCAITLEVRDMIKETYIL